MRRILLLGALLALALPGASSALLDWHFVKVTPTGPRPAVVRIDAVAGAVAWQDAGAHARGRDVVFEDVSCPARVDGSSCVFPIGRHEYRIVGVPSTGVVVVKAAYRAVTLRVSRTSVARGGAVTISGTVQLESPVPAIDVRDRVIVVARPAGRPAYRLASVESSGVPGAWHLVVHPQVTTAYQAVALDHPERFQAARSKTVLVRVQR